MNDVSCQLKRSDKQKMEMSGVLHTHTHIWDKLMNAIYMCDVRIRDGYGYCI